MATLQQHIIIVHMANSTLSSPMPNDDQASRRDRFISAWYPIRDELVQYMEQQQLPKDTCDRYRNNLNYNVLGGKLNRGMSVIDSAEILLGRSLTDEEYGKTVVLGWCIELFQAFCHVSDDIMDKCLDESKIKSCHINGWASQWYPASFTAVVTISGSAEEVTFPSTEHWMMFQKALLFGDHAVAREVAGIEGTSKGDMAYVKSLGRKVKNFDDETWKLHRERIVFEGNLHKFRQHAELKSKLLATGEKEIVEASPHDKIWGIGYGEQAAISRGGLKWGLNLLGKALLQVREALKQEDARRTCKRMKLG
ncbi:FPP/GGPP synthase family protein [Pleurotus pulmonarius]